VNFFVVDLATGYGGFVLFCLLVFCFETLTSQFWDGKTPQNTIIGENRRKKSILLNASGARRLLSLPRAR